MFTNGLMHLHRAGKVTNRKGTEFDGYSVTTFSAGTEELYQWLDGNDEVRFLPVDIVNSPELIARNRKAITINGAMMIDLSSQVVADTINGKQFSGVGGHEDFVSGPRLSPDDRSLLCMPSTATVNSVLVSRVMAQLPMGSVISTPRHNVDVVVTEYGAAELRGRTIRERARLLAGIAHPDFREELLAAAERWPID
jgi:acyl-CoA hydrolase